MVGDRCVLLCGKILQRYYYTLNTYMLITFQAWLGSVFSSIFTCNNLQEKFKKGKCGGTPNETQRIIFSLYFAYAVDVATDLASKSVGVGILLVDLRRHANLV